MSFLDSFSRRKFIYGTTCSICGSLILPSCAEIPLSNRKQLNFYKPAEDSEEITYLKERLDFFLLTMRDKRFCMKPIRSILLISP